RARSANVPPARRGHCGGTGEARQRNRVRRRVSTCAHSTHRARKPVQKERPRPLLPRIDVSADGASREIVSRGPGSTTGRDQSFGGRRARDRELVEKCVPRARRKSTHLVNPVGTI